MNILVTGSAGFTGQVLVEQLKKADHHVIGIDIDLENQSDTFIQHDLTQPFRDKMNIDIVIHLASAVGGFLFNLKPEIIEINDKINNNVLRICKNASCNHLIFFSSINVFEVNQSFVHDSLVSIDQKTPYAISKARWEFLFSKYIKNFMVIRPTNLFGKEQCRRYQKVGESHVIPDLLKKIEAGGELIVFGDGTQVRNFLHVNDVCEFVKLNLSFSGQHFFNLRSEITITIGELAKILLEFLGKKTDIRFDHQFMSYELFRIPNFDLTIPKRYGFESKVMSIKEGLSI